MEKRRRTEQVLISVPHAHSYACYILHNKGYQIFRGEERILEWPKLMREPQWNSDLKINPKFECGSFEKTEHTKKIMDYQIVKSLGYCIVSQKVDVLFKLEERRIRKRKFYSLKPLEKFKELAITNFPKNYWVDYDPTFKTLILRGENADKTLIHLSKQSVERKQNIMAPSLKFAERTGFISGSKEVPLLNNEKKTVEIKEPILGICEEEHKLICLPRFDDPPRMGFVGKTGSYKSIWANSLLNQMYRQWNVPFVHLNDWKFETHEWSRPMTYQPFLEIIEKFGLPRSPSPIVYLTPQKIMKGEYPQEEEEKLMLNNEKVQYFLPLNIKSILQNWNLIFGGFKEMRLEKSKRFFDLNKLAKAKSKQELMRSIKDRKDVPFSSKEKIIGALEKIFEYGLTNLDSHLETDYTVKRFVDQSLVEEFKVNPIIALLLCKINVVIPTSELQSIEFGNTSFVSSYIKAQVNNLINTKRNNPMFKDFPFFVFIDELEQIMAQGANQSIRELSAVTRSENIGFIWSTQTYTSLDPTLKTNTQYLFCMKSGGDINQTNAMAKNYSVDPLVKSELPKLGKKKKGECYLLHDEPVVVYDLDTGKRTIDDDTPFRLSLFPPMNSHLKPKGVGA